MYQEERDECKHEGEDNLDDEEKDEIENDSRGTKIPVTPFSKEKATDQPKSAKCSECNIIMTKKNLKRHMLVHEKGQLKCPTCSRKFYDKWHLNDHLQMHEHPLVCHICGKNLSSRTGLKIHVKQHNSDSQFDCEICNKRFATKQHFEGHRNSVHLDLKPYKCPNCDKAFSYQPQLSRHTQECGVSLNHKGFNCDQCDAILGTKRGLTEHKGGLHANISYRCNCGKSYRWRKSFRRHITKCVKSVYGMLGKRNKEKESLDGSFIEKTDKEKRQTEDVCTMYIKQTTISVEIKHETGALERSLMEETEKGQTEAVCSMHLEDKCETDSLDRSLMEETEKGQTEAVCSMHLEDKYETDHLARSLMEETEKDQTEAVFSMYQEDKCETGLGEIEKSQTESVCSMHLEERDKDTQETEGNCSMYMDELDKGKNETEDNSRGTTIQKTSLSKTKTKNQPKSVKCSECNSILMKESLRKHMVVHKKGKLNCPSCPCKFHDRWHLNDHVKMHESPLVCHICGKTLMSRTGLDIHVKIHNSDNLIKCEICHKTFITEQHYEGHKNSVHLGLKPYKCPRCDKGFAYRSQMYRHKKDCGVSSECKGFSCDQCDAVLGTKHGLVEHIDGMHTKIIYRCNCGKSYPWKKSYRRHVAKCMQSKTDQM